MIFQHARFQIWNAIQHPYKHTLDELPYSNPAMGGDITSIQSAIDWLFKVVYPQPKDAVATTAALPLVGNTLNDYRVVQDDGDGKAAGYRWEQREGDASAKWYKIYDMDWGVDSVLSGFFRATQDHYVVKKGTDDIDFTGAFLTGIDAGQHIWGGASANTHLTLHANAGDGTGAQTGYVQFADHARPTATNTWDLGTAAERFRTGYFTQFVRVGSLALAPGSITDVGGTVDFDTTSVTTDGTVTAATGFTTGTLNLAPGSITDTSGTISFGNENLTTTGNLTVDTVVASLLSVGNTQISDGSITDATGLSFGMTAVTGTGIWTLSEIISGSIDISGNTIQIQTLNTNLVLKANGTGVIHNQSDVLGTNANFTTSISTGLLDVDNVRLDGNTVSTTNTNGNLVLSPDGTGIVQITKSLQPSTNNTLDLGASSTVRFRTLYFGTSLSDGTSSITAGEVLALRNNLFRDSARTLPVQDLDVMSYDNASGTWLAKSLSGTIDHGGLTGLGDDDHTQYALLAGRGVSQTLAGGANSGGTLALRSTSHATQGGITIDATAVLPVADATTDLGSTSSFRFRDLYLSGQLKGARLENFTTAGRPAASASNTGRVIWDTTLLDIFVDSGGTWIQRSVDKYYNEDSTGWTGSATSVSYTMPSDVSDARKMVWCLKNNSDNFKTILCDITHTSATNTTVTVDIALAAGTYTLIGVG